MIFNNILQFWIDDFWLQNQQILFKKNIKVRYSPYKCSDQYKSIFRFSINQRISCLKSYKVIKFRWFSTKYTNIKLYVCLQHQSTAKQSKLFKSYWFNQLGCDWLKQLVLTGWTSFIQVKCISEVYDFTHTGAQVQSLFTRKKNCWRESAQSMSVKMNNTKKHSQ